MEEVPIPADDGRQLFQFFLGRYDAPAFVRRARDVEGTWRVLLAECRRRRDALLEMVKLRLATLAALAGAWEAVRPFLQDAAELEYLRTLEAELRPELRIPLGADSTPRVLRRALQELCASLERFNRRWDDETWRVDLEAINEVRDGYNRYYLVEKECALGSARVARQEFRRLEPITRADVLREFPPLPVPRLS
mgnify:CR=1 FL=1